MTGPIAVIPLRDGWHGKTRLAPEFDEVRRERLIAAMARHVVDVSLSVPALGQVVIVTRDVAYVEAIMQGRDVRMLAQPDGVIGLNGAIALGRAWAMAATGAAGMLILHADLPLLAGDDIEEMLDQRADIVIAADRHHIGTNALLMGWSPGDSRSIRRAESFRPRFGAGSFQAHLAEASRAGCTAATVLQPGTELDLDTIGDWNALPLHLRRELDPGLPEVAPRVHHHSALIP